MYLGSWKINDYLTFTCNTHAPSTGAATDADAVPSYRVYEDETGTPVTNGSTTKLDDAGTTGFYSERVQLLAATGFEKGKTYTIYMSAAVGGVTGTMSHSFQIEAEVDANVVSGAVPSVTGAVGSVSGSVGSVTGAVGSVTGNVGGNVAGSVASLTGHTPQTGDSFARLGAPSGVSIAADLLAIDNFVDDLESRLTAARAGYLDELAAANLPTDVANVKTDTAAILTDTGELQTDWTNGGRLDLILDIIAADTTTDIPALIAALNDLSSANVTTACTSSLTTYDPPTRAEATTDKNSIITEVNANEAKIDILDTNVDSVLADTGTTGVVVAAGSKTGYALSAAGIDSILDEVVEGTLTHRQVLRILLAALAGKSTGGGTTTLTFRDDADGKARITATVDSTGNRTAIAKDGT